MSRKLKITLFSFICAFLVLVSFHGWRFLQANKRAKELIIERLGPQIGSHLHVENMDIRFNAVAFQQIKIAPENAQFSLTIDEIQVGYSLSGFLRYGFQFEKAAEEFLVINPRLLFHESTLSGTRQVATPDIREVLRKWKDGQTHIGFIKRINIQNGQIEWLDSSGTTTILLDNIDGHILAEAEKSTQVALHGDLFEDAKQELEISGNFNLPRGEYRLTGIIENFDVSTPLPFFSHPSWSITQGQLDGKLSLYFYEQGIDQVELTGDINVRHGGFYLPEQDVALDNIALTGYFANNSLYIEKFTQYFEGHPIQYSGRIENIFEPQLDIHMTTDRFPAANFVNKWNSELARHVAGDVQFQLHWTGAVNDPAMTGSIWIEGSSVYDYALSDIEGQLRYTDGKFYCSNFLLQSDALQMLGAASFDTASELLTIDSLNFFINIEDYQQRFALKENATALVFKTEFHGDNKTGSGNFALQIPQEEPFATGHINFRENVYHLISLNEADTLLNIVLHLTDDAPTMQAHINAPEQLLAYLSPHPYVQSLTDHLHFTTNIMWFNHNVYLKGEGFEVREKTREPLFLYTGQLVQDHEEKQFQGTVTYQAGENQSYTLSIDFFQNESDFVVRQIKMPGVFEGWLQAGLDDDADIEGELHVHTDAEVLSTLSGGRYFPVDTGTISGKVLLRGTTQSPEISGQFELSDGVINGAPALFGRVDFQTQSDYEIAFSEIALKQYDQEFLWGEGTYNRLTHGLNIRFEGFELHAEQLLTLFKQPTALLTGVVDWRAHLGGTLFTPVLQGQLQLRTGTLAKVAFDFIDVTILTVFEDNTLPDNHYAGTFHLPQHLKISDGVFRKDSELVLHVQGILPLSDAGSMDLELSGTGNLFAPLPEIHSFFKDTDGEGNFRIRFVGPYDNVTVGSGDLSLSKGSLQFSEILDPASDVQLRLFVDPQMRFITIEELTGILGDIPVSVSNVPFVEIPVSDGNTVTLPPMEFTEDGLNWGVLQLHTPGAGVRVNIPRVMESNDWGRIVLRGRTPEEKFYIAGPVEQPMIRGTIDLIGMHVTFPLLDIGGDGKKSWARRQLENANWDAVAIPKRDNWYFRTEPSTIPAIADNIYINLRIDDKDAGLVFQGSVDDETMLITGAVTASAGSVEYLDQIFQLEYAETFFDEFNQLPIVQGRARTTVRDTLGFPRDIYIVLYSRDPVTGQELTRSSWEDFQFKLTTREPSQTNPALEAPQEEILALLGYSSATFREKAPEVMGVRADNILLRPIFRPVEKRIRNVFNLDEVRIRPSIARNLTSSLVASGLDIRSNEGLQDLNKSYASLFFHSTSLVLGKYIFDDFYLNYTGEIVQASGLENRSELGLSHLLGIEYRIAPGFLLELQYNYQFDRYAQPEDTRIWFRHFFTLPEAEDN